MGGSSQTTWREQLTLAMSPHGETVDDIISIVFGRTGLPFTFPDGEERDEEEDASLDREFDAGYGCAEGGAFCAWTEKRVYFPVQYDGAEWVSSVSREPDGHPIYHVGGG